MPLTRIAALIALAVAVLPAQAIVGGSSTTSFGQVANGVQIAPNWVITARHVGYQDGDTFYNGYGNSLVAATYALPGSYPEGDLELLRLASPIAAPQLSVNATLLGAGTGYDIAATIATGLNQVPRGYAFTAVREFAPLVDPDDAGPLPPVLANFLITGYGAPYVEGGDSGGGLFLGHTTDATTPLWGITSAQIYDEDENGVRSNYRSGFVQLASYRDWIDSTMSTDLADAQMVDWVVTSVPEPGTALLWSLGVMALMAGARKRS